MNLQDFEARVLQMWMTTRIPLTRPNLSYYTHVPRKKMERWLDEMVSEGVLEVDADDEGEMVWSVRGAVRSPSGPKSVAELEKLDSLRSEIGAARGALTLAARAGGLAGRPTQRVGGGEEKSIIASGALSLVLGPVGWLYAAPLREAVPAIILYLLFIKLFWFIPVLGVSLVSLAHLASGLAGMAYAWRHNQTGERTPIVGDVKRALPSRKG